MHNYIAVVKANKHYRKNTRLYFRAPTDWAAKLIAGERARSFYRHLVHGDHHTFIHGAKLLKIYKQI